MPGDTVIMPISSLNSDGPLQWGMRRPQLRRLLIGLTLLGLLCMPGCLFKKNKPPAAPKLPAPVRATLLPLNVPVEKADLRWISLATVVCLADFELAAPDIDLVPVYESIPAALQSLGEARTISTDIAELVASRLSARWSLQGEVLGAGNTLTLRLDFIPAKPSLVPFRYEKAISSDSLRARLQEACDQFLSYLIVRPLPTSKIRPMDVKKLREIADALDLEYGWFVAAKPGASGKVVEDLARSSPALARVLFSPTLYPVLAK
jgi:hypothetical protein